MRTIFLALMFAFPVLGCDFDGSPDRGTVSGTVRFSWTDIQGRHEIERTYAQDGPGLRSSDLLVFGETPPDLKLQGPFDAEFGECSASIWIEGKTLVHAGCAKAAGQNEIIIQGLALFLESHKDAVHSVQISSGTKTYSFSIRTLPVSIGLIQSGHTTGVLKVSDALPWHRIRTLTIQPTAQGALQLDFPTAVHAQILRTFQKFGASTGLCRIDETVENIQENIPVELKIVEERPGLETDWPETFSKQVQTLTTKTDRPVNLAVYALSDFTAKFFEGAFLPERTHMATMNGWCTEGDPGRRLHREPMTRDMQVGRFENSPRIQFSLSEVKISQSGLPDSDAIKSQTLMTKQDFDIELSREVR